MNRRRVVFFPLIFCSVFSIFTASCGRQKLLLLTDHYLYEAGYFTDERMQEIEKAVREEGKSVELQVIEYGEGASAQILRAVQESRAQTAVITPMLAGPAGEAVQNISREISVVLMELGTAAAEEAAGKETAGGSKKSGGGEEARVYRLQFSRIEAFSTLGRELGSVLSGMEAAAEPAVGAVGMWYIGTEQRKREYEAFMESFSAVCSADRLEIELVQKVPDSPAIRNYLEDIRKEGVLFGIAFISHQNPELITSYRGLGFGIVSEYLSPLEKLPVSGPVLSVEYPLPDAAAAAAQLTGSEEPRVSVDAEVIKKNFPGQN